MSTRDKLYGILDTLDDDQLESLFRFLSNIIPVKNTDREANEDEIDKLMGIFHDAADPNKIPFEMSTESDPFYSSANMEHLRQSAAQMERTGGTVHEIGEIEDDD